MPAFICRTCGVQHADTREPPATCAICTDARQYVGEGGQQWTTLDDLVAEGHRSEIRLLEPGLYGIGVSPSFGIGQRSLLVVTDAGNVLWDVTGFVDDSAFAHVRAVGGLTAVASSHPHFHGVMVEWAEQFDAAILVPAVDAQWVRRADHRIELYDEHVEVVPGVTVVRTGGHFPGSAVLHWASGADGRGVLLTGDSLMVAQDRRWVSVMWSYPNLVPVDAAELDRVGSALEGLAFDRIYAGWWDRVVPDGAAIVVERSLARYRTAIAETEVLERAARPLGEERAARPLGEERAARPPDPPPQARTDART